jgi:hypothetical protein
VMAPGMKAHVREPEVGNQALIILNIDLGP